MDQTVKTTVAGLNRKSGSNCLLMLEGTGFEKGLKVDAVYTPGGGGTPILWSGKLKLASANGKHGLASLTRNPGAADRDTYEDLRDGEQVTVTVGNSPPTPVPATLYDE